MHSHSDKVFPLQIRSHQISEVSPVKCLSDKGILSRYRSAFSSFHDPPPHKDARMSLPFCILLQQIPKYHLFRQQGRFLPSCPESFSPGSDIPGLSDNLLLSLHILCPESFYSSAARSLFMNLEILDKGSAMDRCRSKLLQRCNMLRTSIALI